MSSQPFENHPYVERLKKLNEQFPERSEFHARSGEILQ